MLCVAVRHAVPFAVEVALGPSGRGRRVRALSDDDTACRHMIYIGRHVQRPRVGRRCAPSRPRAAPHGASRLRHGGCRRADVVYGACPSGIRPCPRTSSRRAGHLRRRIIWSIGGCHPEKKKTHRTARRFCASRRHGPPRFARVSGPHTPCRPACREKKKKDRREATVRDGAPESNRMRAHVRAARACVALRDSSPSPVARYPPVPLSSVRSGLEPQWTERRLPDRRPSASHVASRDAGRRHGAACRVAPSRPSYRT